MKVKPNINRISELYNIEKHHPEIIEVKNFLSKEECDLVINKAKSLTDEEWSVVYLDSIKQQAKAYYGEDDYQVLVDNGTIGINYGIIDKVAGINIQEKSEEWVNKLIQLFDNNDLIIPIPGSYNHIQRHYSGSKFDYHIDSDGFDGKADSNVVYTAVLYFNDDYIDGYLDFPNQKVSFKPEAGSLVIFNSGPSFLHGVKPIGEGPTRYAATCFIREKGVQNES